MAGSKKALIGVAVGGLVGLAVVLGLLSQQRKRQPTDDDARPAPTKRSAVAPKPPPKAKAAPAKPSGRCLLPGPTLAQRAAFSKGAQNTPPAILDVKKGAPEIIPGDPKKTNKDKTLFAFAFQYSSPIFASAAKGADIIGHVHRGSVLPISRRVWGSGCDRGKWYEIAGPGYLCTRRGFTVSVDPVLEGVPVHLPDTSRPLVFSWAKMRRRGLPRLWRFPTAAENKELDGLMAVDAGAGRTWPEVVERGMDGAFLLALDRLERSDDGLAYYRTIRGRYLKADLVKPFPVYPMHGVKLGKKLSLPLAFVYGEDRPALRQDGDAIRECGVAQKHARFAVTGQVTHRGKALVVGPDGVMVARDGVRLAQKIARPEKVSADDRWIHVDLSEQVLVAYEGDEPVFATLVSSGKKGYEPPLGTYRIHLKYLTVTMNASDPIDGWYEVEEVPWTMYYWEGFALHGAYWHNKFGEVKSHGCTNLAPPDARWLFHWTEPRVPQRWHGKSGTGTHVRFTK